MTDYADYSNFSSEALEEAIRGMVDEARTKYPDATEEEIMKALTESATKLIRSEPKPAAARDLHRNVIASRLVWLTEHAGRAVVELAETNKPFTPGMFISQDIKFQRGPIKYLVELKVTAYD